MPRTGKGGARTGSVGTAYSNRTDLNASVPVATATNQPYGEATRQRAEQGAIPMAPTQVAPQAANPVGAAQTTVPLASSVAKSTTPPGSLPFLEPTSRPDEPVHTGLATGPGSGTEVMNQNVLPTHPVSQAFDDMAQSSNASPAVSNLANTARLLGL